MQNMCDWERAGRLRGAWAHSHPKPSGRAATSRVHPIPSLVRSSCIRLGLVLASVVSMHAGALAQTFDLINGPQGPLYEPLLGSQVISNARALSLGGAYSVLVTDASALWYNPASLGRVEYGQLQAEFVYDKVTGKSDALTGLPDAPPPTVYPQESSLSNSRIGAVYLALPLESTGHWTLGLGTAVTHRLDRALAADLTFAPGDWIDTLNSDPNAYVAEQIEHYMFSDDQRGAIWGWQFGVGGRISPNVMLGAAGTYYDGSLEFNNRTSFTGTRYEDTSSVTPGFPVRWDITTTTHENIHGWGAHGGLFIRLLNNIGLSGVIRSPVKYQIESDQLITEQRDQGGTVETVPPGTIRWLQTPLSASAGVAVRLRGLRVAGEATFTDWSQSEYKDSPWIGQFNDLLRTTYREELALALGAEFAPFKGPLAFRAGYRQAHLPYNEHYSVNDRQTLSAGVGMVFDGSVHLDFGGSLETLRGRNPLYGFDEEYENIRFLVTTSYDLQ